MCVIRRCQPESRSPVAIFCSSQSLCVCSLSFSALASLFIASQLHDESREGESVCVCVFSRRHFGVKLSSAACKRSIATRAAFPRAEKEPRAESTAVATYFVSRGLLLPPRCVLMCGGARYSVYTSHVSIGSSRVVRVRRARSSIPGLSGGRNSVHFRYSSFVTRDARPIPLRWMGCKKVFQTSSRFL